MSAGEFESACHFQTRTRHLQTLLISALEPANHPELRLGVADLSKPALLAGQLHRPLHMPLHLPEFTELQH